MITFMCGFVCGVMAWGVAMILVSLVLSAVYRKKTTRQWEHWIVTREGVSEFYNEDGSEIEVSHDEY